MITRAGKFLKNVSVLEQEVGDIDQPGTDQTAQDDIPGTNVTGDEPHDDNPGAPDLQALESAMEQNPAFTSDTMDSVKGMLERYMSEEDPSYTPDNDDDKMAVDQAIQAMDQACNSMRRFKGQ